MQRGNLDDLSAFMTVAREGSFTKAAAKLGCFAVRAQLYHQGARGASQAAPVNAHHAQRLANGSGRAPIT